VDRPDVEAPVAPDVDEDLECYGVGNVTKNGQITVPADARAEIGIEPNGRVMFFGDRRSGRLIVTSAPPAGDLLEFVTDQETKKRR
jgi:AbrB family looped-hinge helix DNA binding protein